MPKYIYTAKGYNGESKGGEMVAKDEKTLALQLRSEGFLITSVRDLSEKNKVGVKFFDRFVRVPLKEKMMFARNLSVMVASGVNITKAMSNLSIQARSKKFKKILQGIGEELQGGKNLSDCLAKYPPVFNELFVNMVKVGEAGGNLDESLQIIAIQLEKEHELISKVRGALLYPAVIVVAMIGIAVLMLTYVLPKITSTFKDMNVELPKTTQFVINISDILRNHSILVTLLLFGFIALVSLFRKTEAGKKFFSFLTLHLPVTRDLTMKINCARFARIYSSLLKSGVSVIDSLNIVANTLGNYYFRKEIERAIDQVQKGVNLSKVITPDSKIFPSLISQMLEVGEETGKTEVVLFKLAEFYEDEVAQITKNLSSIIEPVLMLLIGGAVGFFAVSMFQPMYSVLENIK